MKGLLLLSLLIIGCSKSIDDSLLIDNSGLMYLPNSDKAFTGKAYRNYKNGNTEYEGTYEDGRVEGLVTMWYQGGQKKAEQKFQSGEIDGLGVTWYVNGQKKSEQYLEGDKLVGLSTLWYENGQKKEEKNYNNGKLSDEKSWDPDGNLKE